MNKASEVLVGSASMRVAILGSILPTFDGTVPIVWDAAFVQVGYTEDGTDLQYQPTFTDIKVDEELAPVKTILTEEKGTISAKLAQASINNIALAISASKVVVTAGVAPKKTVTVVKVGSGIPQEMIVVLEGTSPDGFPRVVVGYRAQAAGNVSMAFKKKDKTILPCEFRLLADSSKPAGERLFAIYDYETPA